MEPVLLQSPLFGGIPPQELPALLQALGAHRRTYPAGSILLLMDDPVTEMGILLSGTASALMGSPGGRELLVNRLSPPDLFAEVLAVGRGARSPVTVTAESECRVLWLPTARLLGEELPAPLGHQLLRNLTAVLSSEYFALQRRLLCLTQDSLREKILFYLLQMQSAAHAGSFSIPLDRSGLARYLGAERSALCRELSRMQQAGLIRYHKNQFTICSK